MSDLKDDLFAILVYKFPSVAIHYYFLERTSDLYRDKEWCETGWKADVSNWNWLMVKSLFSYALYLFGKEVDRPEIRRGLEGCKAEYDEDAEKWNNNPNVREPYDLRHPLDVPVEAVYSFSTEYVNRMILGDVYEQHVKDEENVYLDGYYGKYTAALKDVETTVLKYADDKERAERLSREFLDECNELWHKTVRETLPGLHA